MRSTDPVRLEEGDQRVQAGVFAEQTRIPSTHFARHSFQLDRIVSEMMDALTLLAGDQHSSRPPYALQTTPRLRA
jgi:hypothetical protein